MRTTQTWKTERARALRSRSPAAETLLWSRLRNRQLAGFKFVRQAPIGSYFADFLCREAMLIVELDGATHSADTEIAADNVRSADLTDAGCRLIRVSNTDIRQNMTGVLDGILDLLAAKT